MPVSSKRFFRNYTKSLLTLKIDRRGLVVNQSRIGYAKLMSVAGGYVDALDGFTGISLGQSCSVEDDAFLEQSISSLTLTSNNRNLFNTYDGERITLAYNGTTLFDGFVQTSTLALEFDLEDRTEVAKVQLTCRSFDASTYQLPPVLGTLTVYGTPENPGNSVVPGRPAELIFTRARAVTGEDILNEDVFASPLTDELVGPITSQEASTNQGALMQEMSHRAGVLVDLTGVTPSWRSYQLVPRWRITDADVQSFELETDQDSPGALIYTRDEDSTDKIAYSLTGTNKLERTVSTGDTQKWGLMHAAAVTPLKRAKQVYLSSFELPFSSTVPLVSRLPLRVTYHRSGVTYRGAVIGMSHAITPLRWMVSADVAPVHLVTRVSDLTPATPWHMRSSAGAGTFTLSWTGSEVVGTATTAGTTSTIKVSDANALDIDVGDQLWVYTSAGVKRDPRLATVVSEVSASGTTTITLDIALASATAAGDYLCWADFGVKPTTWDVWFGIRGASQVSPVDGGATPTKVTVSSPTITLTGLPAGSYRATVFARTPDGFKSPPSQRLVLTVT